MAKRNRLNEDVTELLQRGADREQRLYKRERQAERELAKLRADLNNDQERLEQARDRVAKRLAAIARAEETLRQRQAERAAGPGFAAPDPEPTGGASRAQAAAAAGEEH